MARTPRPQTPRSSLIRMLWVGALLAIPFALFFKLLFGGARSSFFAFYLVSIIFCYANSIATWAVGWFVVTRLMGGRKGGKAIVLEVASYASAAIIASFAAAVILHFTLVPGFLGNLRQFMIIGMFTLLFAALFIGLSYAAHFYQEAIARARSEEELNLARRIQRSFLLSQFPSRPGIEVHALNVSSKQVSGDFYDVVPAGDRAFLLCVADVSGKGVPAALLGSMLQASLRTQAPIATSVGAMVTNLNHMLCEGVANGQFATLFLGRVDEATMSLSYVNAGHNHPVLLRANGARELLDKGGPMVGIIDGIPFEEAAVALAPGDRIVLYTDGLSEAMDAKLEMYGDERIADVAAALPADQSARESIDSIMAGISAFLAGEEPQDDMTLMVLRVLGVPEPAPGPAALPGVR